jgi:hypothetical protein
MLQRTICRHVLIVLTLAVTIAGQATASAKDKLKAEDQRVLTYLMGDWGKDYSVTSVDIAMRAVKVKDTDETRFRVGSYIKAHPELHEVIRRWRWVTFVLTPDEKLIARALINAERDGKPAPNIAEIAKAVGVSEDQAKRSLSMLERYEILQRNSSRGGTGFSVMPRYIKWEPRLDFLFHQVTLADGRQFNTN